MNFNLHDTAKTKTTEDIRQRYNLGVLSAFFVKKNSNGKNAVGINATPNKEGLKVGGIAQADSFVNADGILLPVNQSVNGRDMNSVIETGFYYGYTMTNAAETGGASTFEVMKYNPDWIVQKQYVIANSGWVNYPVPRVYIRQRHSGTAWTAWVADSESPEFGYWTPTIYGSTTAGSVTYNSQRGRYYKTGKLCTLFIEMSVSSFSGLDGYVLLGGIPFVATNSSGLNVTTAFESHGIVRGTAVGLSGVLTGTVTYIYLYTDLWYYTNVLTYDILLPNQIQSTGGFSVRGSITYETN